MYPLFKQHGKILLSSFRVFKSGSFYVQSLKVREMVMIICKCLADYVGLCVLDFLFYFFYFLWMMWFRWLHQVLTSSSHWGSLWLSEKQLRRLAPQSLRSWFSAWKGWGVHSGSGASCCPRVKQFKYLVVFLMSEGRVEQEIDRWVIAASATMQLL